MIRSVKQYRVNDVYLITKATPKPKKPGNKKLEPAQCARQEARDQHLIHHKEVEGLTFRVKGFPTRHSVVLINTTPAAGKPGLIKTSITEFDRWQKVKQDRVAPAEAE